MLEFREITKIFKTDLIAQPFKALDKVSFTIPEGAMVGFLGANGAGKTTSLKIIMDFIRPDGGAVKFSDKIGKKKTDIFKNIGFLPERPYFYPNLTGYEFLNFMGTLSEMPSHQIKISIERWGERFRINHALSRPLRTYSKGMLQRIGFLSTILHEPRIVILDEPLSGLDPIGRKELKDVIVDIHKEGKTVFFSTHIVSDIEEVCDRVIFLKEGKLVYDGLVDKLLRTGEETDFLVRFRDKDDGAFTTSLKKIERYSGDLRRALVSETNKTLFLNELLIKKKDIVGLEVVKPSLEEIFYNIKSG